MVATACPYCLKIVDARGYNSHVRACEAKQKDKEIQDGIDKMTDVNEPKTVPDIKNSKPSTLGKTIVWAAGVIVVVIIGILMLISPKSTESNMRESEQSSQKRTSRLHR